MTDKGILDEVFDPMIEEYKEYQRRVVESNGGKPRVSYFLEVIEVLEKTKQQLAERIKKEAFSAEPAWSTTSKPHYLEVIDINTLLREQKK
jgi:hypothetical protein